MSNEPVSDIDTDREDFYTLFRDKFNVVLPDELTDDEMLALSEEQLHKVYEEFGRG